MGKISRSTLFGVCYAAMNGQADGLSRDSEQFPVCRELVQPFWEGAGSGPHLLGSRPNSLRTRPGGVSGFLTASYTRHPATLFPGPGTPFHPTNIFQDFSRHLL